MSGIVGRPARGAGPAGQIQLPPAGVALAATFANVWLAFDPRVVMAAMHTTMIRASITAYSTAVGPSSFFTNSTNVLVSFRMTVSRELWLGWGPAGHDRNRPPASQHW